MSNGVRLDRLPTERSEASQATGAAAEGLLKRTLQGSAGLSRPSIRARVLADLQSAVARRGTNAEPFLREFLADVPPENIAIIAEQAEQAGDTRLARALAPFARAPSGPTDAVSDPATRLAQTLQAHRQNPAELSRALASADPTTRARALTTLQNDGVDIADLYSGIPDRAGRQAFMRGLTQSSQDSSARMLDAIERDQVPRKSNIPIIGWLIDLLSGLGKNPELFNQALGDAIQSLPPEDRPAFAQALQERGFDLNELGERVSPQAREALLQTAQQSGNPARTADEIQNLLRGSTSAEDQSRVLELVEGAEDPSLLMSAMDRKGVSLQNVLSELDNPAHRRRAYDTLLPGTSPEQRAALIDELASGSTDDWEQKLLVETLVREQNPAELLDATSRSHDIDLKRILDEVDNPADRNQLMSAVVPKLSIAQRSEAVASLAKGHTSSEEEQSILGIFQSTADAGERQQILDHLKARHGIDYGRILEELENPGENRAFADGVLNPEQARAMRDAGIPIGRSERQEHDASATLDASGRTVETANRTLESPVAAEDAAALTDLQGRLQRGNIADLREEQWRAPLEGVTTQLRSNIEGTLQSTEDVDAEIGRLQGLVERSTAMLDGAEGAQREELESAISMANERITALEARKAELGTAETNLNASLGQHTVLAESVQRSLESASSVARAAPSNTEEAAATFVERRDALELLGAVEETVRDKPELPVSRDLGRIVTTAKNQVEGLRTEQQLRDFASQEVTTRREEDAALGADTTAQYTATDESIPSLTDSDAAALDARIDTSATLLEERAATREQDVQGAQETLEGKSLETAASASDVAEVARAEAIVGDPEGTAATEGLNESAASLRALQTEVAERKAPIISRIDQQRAMVAMEPTPGTSDAEVTQSLQQLGTRLGVEITPPPENPTVEELTAWVNQNAELTAERVGLVAVAANSMIGELGLDPGLAITTLQPEAINHAVDGLARSTGSERGDVIDDLISLSTGTLPADPKSGIAQGAERPEATATAIRMGQDPTALAQARALAGLQAVSTDSLPADALQAISTRTSDQAAAAELMAERGVQIDPQTVGLTGQALITREQSLRQLAASAFNIPEGEVGPMHYQLLLQQNPELAPAEGQERGDAVVAEGTVVSLAPSPTVLGLQRTQLQASIANVDYTIQFADDPPLGQEERTRLLDVKAALQERLTEVEHSEVATRGLLDVASATTAAQAQASTGDLEGLEATYGAVETRLNQQISDPQTSEDLREKLEAVRSQLISSRGASAEGAARVLLLQQQDGAAAREAIARARRDYASVTEGLEPDQRVPFQLRQVALSQLEARTYLADPELQEYRQENGDMTYGQLNDPLPNRRVQQSDRDRVAAHGRFMDGWRGIDASFNRLRTQLEGIESDDPEVRALVDQQLAGLEAEKLLVRADMYGTIGDRANGVTNLFRALDHQASLQAADFEANDSRYISTDNEELSWLGSVFSSDTTVGFLTDRKRNQAVAALQRLPDEQRARALETLYKIGGTYADMGDIDGTNTVRQVLDELGDRTNDAEITTQSLFIASNYRQQIGDLDGAVEVLAEARREAATISDPAVRRQLGARAAMAYGSSIATLAAAGDSKSVRENAARQLRTFRQEMQRPNGPLNREQVAQLMLMEANTFLTVNRSADALRTVEALEEYRDIAAIDNSLTEWMESNDKGNVEAFMKVALRELNNESMGEALLGAGGGAAAGAAAGAAIGVWFFGVGALVGAGVGAIAGGALGTAAVKVNNLYRGWDNIAQAGETGFTHLTGADALMDAGFLALDVVSVVLPVKGGGKLVGQGVKSTVSSYTGSLTRAVVANAAEELSDDAVIAVARELGLRDGRQFVRNVMEEAGRLQARGVDPSEYIQQAARTAVAKQFSEQALDFGNKYVRTAWAVGGVGALGGAMGPLMWEGVEAHQSGDQARIAAWKRNMTTAGVTLAVMGGGMMTAARFSTNPRMASRELRRLVRESGDDAAALANRVEARLANGADAVPGGALDEIADVDGTQRPRDVTPGGTGTLDDAGDAADAAATARRSQDEWIGSLDEADAAAARTLFNHIDDAATEFSPAHFDRLVRLTRNGISPETAIRLSEPAAAKLHSALPDIYGNPVHLEHNNGLITFSDGTTTRMSQEQLTSPAQRQWDTFSALVDDPAVLNRVRQDLRPSISRADWRAILRDLSERPEGRVLLADHRASRFAKGAPGRLERRIAQKYDGKSPDDLPIDVVVSEYNALWRETRDRFHSGNSLTRRAGVELSETAPGMDGTPVRDVDDLYRRIQESTFSIYSRLDDAGSGRTSSIDPLSHRNGGAHRNIHIGRHQDGIAGNLDDVYEELIHQRRGYEPTPSRSVEGWAGNLVEEAVGRMYPTAAFDMQQLREVAGDPNRLRTFLRERQASYVNSRVGGDASVLDGLIDEAPGVDRSVPLSYFGSPSNIDDVVDVAMRRLDDVMSNGPHADRIENLVAFMQTRMGSTAPSPTRAAAVTDASVLSRQLGALGVSSDEIAGAAGDAAALNRLVTSSLGSAADASDLAAKLTALTDDADGAATLSGMNWGDVISRWRANGTADEMAMTARLFLPDSDVPAFNRLLGGGAASDGTRRLGAAGRTAANQDGVGDAVPAGPTGRPHNRDPELRDLSNKVHPNEHNVVRYMDQYERRRYRVTVRDGKLFDADGRPVDTSNAVSKHNGPGWGIFVMGPDNELYLANTHGDVLDPRTGQAGKKFHHSTFFAGRAVPMAGEMRVSNGQILGITDESGHYAPTSAHSTNFLNQLRSDEFNLDLTGVEFRSWQGRNTDVGRFLSGDTPSPTGRTLDAPLDTPRDVWLATLDNPEVNSLPDAKLEALAGNQQAGAALRNGRVPGLVEFVEQSDLPPAQIAERVVAADRVAAVGGDPAAVRAAMDTPGELDRILVDALAKETNPAALQLRVSALGGLPEGADLGTFARRWSTLAEGDRAKLARALSTQLDDAQKAQLARLMSAGAASDGSRGMSGRLASEVGEEVFTRHFPDQAAVEKAFGGYVDDAAEAWDDFKTDIMDTDLDLYRGIGIDDVFTPEALDEVAQVYKGLATGDPPLPDTITGHGDILRELGAAYDAKRVSSGRSPPHDPSFRLTPADVRARFNLGGPAIDTGAAADAFKTAGMSQSIQDAVSSGLYNRNSIPPSLMAEISELGTVLKEADVTNKDIGGVLGGRLQSILDDLGAGNADAVATRVQDLTARAQMFLKDAPEGASPGVLDAVLTSQRSIEELQGILSDPNLRPMLRDTATTYAASAIASNTPAEALPAHLRYARAVHDGPSSHNAIADALQSGDDGMRAHAASRLGVEPTIDIPSDRLLAIAADPQALDAFKNSNLPDLHRWLRDVEGAPNDVASALRQAHFLKNTMGFPEGEVIAAMGSSADMAKMLDNRLRSFTTAREVRAFVDQMNPQFPDRMPPELALGDIVTTWRLQVSAKELKQMGSALRLGLPPDQVPRLGRLLNAGAASDGSRAMGGRSLRDLHGDIQGQFSGRNADFDKLERRLLQQTGRSNLSMDDVLTADAETMGAVAEILRRSTDTSNPLAPGFDSEARALQGIMQAYQNKRNLGPPSGSAGDFDTNFPQYRLTAADLRAHFGMESAWDASAVAGKLRNPGLRDWVESGRRNGKPLPTAAQGTLDEVSAAVSRRGVSSSQANQLERQVLDLLDSMNSQNRDANLARISELTARFDAMHELNAPGLRSDEVMSAVLAGDRSAAEIRALLSDDGVTAAMNDLGKKHPMFFDAVWNNIAYADEVNAESLTQQMRFAQAITNPQNRSAVAGALDDGEAALRRMATQRLGVEGAETLDTARLFALAQSQDAIDALKAGRIPRLLNIASESDVPVAELASEIALADRLASMGRNPQSIREALLRGQRMTGELGDELSKATSPADLRVKLALLNSSDLVGVDLAPIVSRWKSAVSAEDLGTMVRELGDMVPAQQRAQLARLASAGAASDGSRGIPEPDYAMHRVANPILGIPNQVREAAVADAVARIPGLTEAQAQVIFEQAFKRGSPVVFGGSRVRGNFADGSDLDIGYYLSPAQAGKIRKKLGNVEGGVDIEQTIIVPGNETPTIARMDSPEEFFMRSGVREPPDPRAGEPFSPSGWIRYEIDGSVTEMAADGTITTHAPGSGILDR